MEPSVNIYTDGSCINNGKSGAVASIGVWVQGFPDLCLSERISGPQTNQVAELTAIKRALDIATDFKDINIFTDSHYAMKCVTVWCLNWERNGWKSSRGKSPTNMELVKEIISKMRSMESTGKLITFHYVPGHSGDMGNDEADRLATLASRSG